MLRRFLRRVLGTPVAVAPPPSSWETYRDYVHVHPSVIIDPCATIRIFNPPDPPRICLEIGEGSHIFANFALLRPKARIRIGARCQIGSSNFVSAESIEVGDDVLMASGITLMDSNNHSIYWEERQFDVERCRKDYVATAGQDLARTHDWRTVSTLAVQVGDKAWIGASCLVLKGVSIGEGAIIGAGSVVTRSIPSWTIAGGNPCREIRPVTRSRPE